MFGYFKKRQAVKRLAEIAEERDLLEASIQRARAKHLTVTPMVERAKELTTEALVLERWL
jgi:hypothetical protein